MCKTNVKTNLYYVNICKHEYENNMTKIGFEQIKGNEGPTPIYTPLGT